MASRREILAGAALAAAVIASISLFAANGEAPPETTARASANPEADTRSAVPALGPAAGSAEDAQALRVDLLRRDAQEGAGRDVFEAHSWYRPPPPAPPPKAEPPPPPSAPAVPFVFVGTFESAEGKPVIYLAEGDKVHTVSEGEVINDVWRVETGGMEEIVLLYLPLSIRQPLALGSAK